MQHLRQSMKYYNLLLILQIIPFALGSISDLNDINANEIKDKILSNGYIPPELANTNINITDFVDVFKEKCSQNSGSDAAFEEATQATNSFSECLQNQIVLDDLQKEIAEAKPTGNLDTVFNKYCNKRNEVIECVENFTTSIDPCLNKEEKDQKMVFINITKRLVEFVCHENGNQIALFIAEKGPECFETKNDQLQECLNATLGKYMNHQLPTIDNLPSLVIKEEHCIDMNVLEDCIVTELETCDESTPANLMEALFRFVRKETPCGPKPAKALVRNSSNYFSISIILFTLTVLSLFV